MLCKKKLSRFCLCIVTLTALLGPVSISAQPVEKPAKEKKGGRGEGEGRKTPAPVYPGNIIIGCPSATTAMASIILGKGYEGYIEYEPETGGTKKKTALFKTSNDEPFEITITGLQPGIRYLYRLYYNNGTDKKFTAASASWFATRKDPASSFTFGVQGDSHPEREGKMFNPLLYTQTIKQAAEQKPDFYFLMGDDFNIDRLLSENNATRENVEAVYKLQRHYLGNAGTNPPLFLVNGNHEQAAKYLLNGTPDNAAVQAGLARKKYFPLPEPSGIYSGDKDSVGFVGLLKDYYAFEWGNALFVVIDPYWHSDVPVDNTPRKDGEEKQKRDPWGATLGKEQYDWLKKTLETSKAKFKFVFAHHVNGTGRGGVERAKLFEWGGYGQNGQWQFDRFRPGWAMPVHQLFAKNKVTIFFQGHDHLFAKQELDGVIYQSVPNPADDTHTAFNKDAYTSGEVLPNSGFLHITVGPDDVKVDYVRSYFKDNTALPEDAKKPFSYTIRK